MLALGLEVVSALVITGRASLAEFPIHSFSALLAWACPVAFGAVVLGVGVVFPLVFGVGSSSICFQDLV